MRSLGKRLKLICAAALVGATLTSAAMAQDPPRYAERQNAYIWVKLGQSGKVVLPNVEYEVIGRWAVGTVMGNPEVDNDDNLQYTYLGAIAPCGDFGYTTVQVDGASLRFGQTSEGAWVQTEPYEGATGWYVTATWIHTKSQVSVKQTISIIRDMARFEYIIKNNDPVDSHSVGLRILGDVVVDGVSGMPTAGNAVAYPYVPGRGFLNRETDMVGAQIPIWFDVYNDPVNPTVATRNILGNTSVADPTGQDGQDATRPDRLAIGEWGNLTDNLWTYAPITDKAISDWGWAYWWNPVALSPNQERKIVTYFGVSAASESWTSGANKTLDKICAALQAPQALRYNAGSIAYPSDNEFLVKGYIYNLGDFDLNNVSAALSLPEGLELVEGDPTQTAKGSDVEGKVPAEKESAPIVWKVRATGTVSGLLKYSMLVTADGLTKQVTRTIAVPATLKTRVVGNQWQLMSMPFEFRNPIPSTALTFTPSMGFEIQSYDSTLTGPYPYKALDTLQPGLGFWIKPNLDGELVLAGDAKALQGAATYKINLNPGWNLFGNPYVYPICLGQVSVINGATHLSLEEAALRGWIRRTVYWWDVGSQTYDYTSDRAYRLEPFRGYWIKALTKCQLVIPAVDQIGADIVVEPATNKGNRSKAVQPVGPYGKDNWKLCIVARAGDAVDDRNLFGVDTRAADGYDPSDVERPPSMEGYVTVTFPHRDWGTNSGSFLRDIRRSAGAQQSWDMEVTTDMKDTDVVLTWPDLVNLPKDVVLKLVDVDGNVTRHMRTTSSYRYNSGNATTRRFKLVAEPASLGRLLITGLNVSQSRAVGGATISYALSTDASTDVRVKSMSGKTVRNLAIGRNVTRGISNLSWNYRTESGEPVPAGSYLVEVVATTPEGEVAKDIRPFIVAR